MNLNLNLKNTKNTHVIARFNNAKFGAFGSENFRNFLCFKKSKKFFYGRKPPSG